MKNERKAEIKVGITTVISLIIFIWIMGWSKNFIRTSSDVEINIVFENVSGLEIDDDVTIRGLRKGFVKDIILDRNIIIVKISIDQTADLRKDAVFMLSTVDLMGGKKIEINPGTSQIPVDYSQIQNGYFSGDISTAMAMLSSVQNDLVDVIKEVKISLNNVNEIFSDKEFSNNVKTSFQNITELSNQLNQLIVSNKEDISALINSSKNLTESANSLITENKEQLAESLKRLNEFINNSDTLVLKIDESISEIKNKENNLGKILYDENFLKGLTETLDQVKELTKLLKAQLEGEGINVDAHIF